ncbi:MAG: SnoaL-like polyketide cyclase, partial [Proteobacteria bacterium]|nr:SnoaL-like polyketide cyclase [Pseudomonadota bacterium]
VDGDHAFIVWTARTADRNYELGTDTFVIRDGKIILQSFASKTTPSA